LTTKLTKEEKIHQTQKAIPNRQADLR